MEGWGKGTMVVLNLSQSPKGLSHEEMGEWVGSQGNMAGEGNQPVSQVFTGKQEALVLVA